MLAGRIIEHVVAVPDGANGLHNFSIERIQYDHTSGTPADYKHPVIRLIESHRIIGLRPARCPGGDDLPSLPIHHSDLLSLFIHDSERAAPVAHVNTIPERIIANVIRVLSPWNRLQKLE